jgi:Icc-related predicted phosphoesterase
MAKIIYATDVHGDGKIYEMVLDRGKSREIEAIVIGGDIAPTGFSNSYMAAQREFLERHLIPRFRKFRDGCKKDIYIMMGNDDFAANMDVLVKAEREGIIRLLHNNLSRISNFNIIGYSFVNPIPFLLKDWEKEEGEIEKDLEKLKKLAEPKKTIYVFHAPPFGTSLDILHSGVHAGSIAIREFIEKEQPFLTLHGHIHESFEISGRFFEKIGETVAVNPGGRGMVIIDLKKLGMEFIGYGV